MAVAHCTDLSPSRPPPCTRAGSRPTAGPPTASRPIGTPSPATRTPSWHRRLRATTWTQSAMGSHHRWDETKSYSLQCRSSVKGAVCKIYSPLRSAIWTAVWMNTWISLSVIASVESASGFKKTRRNKKWTWSFFFWARKMLIEIWNEVTSEIYRMAVMSKVVSS